jgi:D-arginine dehydrogenase
LAELDRVPIVIVGAGVAGASTAAALARAGAGPGVILEREAIPGSHASGKNAGIARTAEFDPVVRRLAVETVRRLRRMDMAGEPILRQGSGLYLGRHHEAARFEDCAQSLRALGARAEVLDAAAARTRFPFLTEFAFDIVLHSAEEGVIDIHALLLAYLDEAREGGFTLLTRTDVADLQVDGSRVCGVRTSRGIIRTDRVVDASGAWAGRLGDARRLPLQPVRRHLFVTADRGGVPAVAPVVWHVSERFYLRPEGSGLLLSPCDESSQEPGVPQIDPGAADLLATKLVASVPALADLEVRTSWACLRTFAPDRRPIIGPDPDMTGLFHVSGLGGAGMGTSWAIGEIAAALLRGERAPFIDAADVAPDRFVQVSGTLTEAAPRVPDAGRA